MFENMFWIDGRDGRIKYWLLTWILPIPVALITGFIASFLFPGDEGNTSILEDAFIAVLLITVMWIWICSSVRRCHDRNKSGWWVLLTFVPVLGWIWMIVDLGILPGTDGSNEFGPQADF